MSDGQRKGDGTSPREVVLDLLRQLAGHELEGGMPTGEKEL